MEKKEEKEINPFSLPPDVIRSRLMNPRAFFIVLEAIDGQMAGSVRPD